MALMTFEQLDRSIDADSDSDDELAEQAHMYRSTPRPPSPSPPYRLRTTVSFPIANNHHHTPSDDRQIQVPNLPKLSSQLGTGRPKHHPGLAPAAFAPSSTAQALGHVETAVASQNPRKGARGCRVRRGFRGRGRRE